MKFIKRLFLFICAIVMLAGISVTILAFNPSITNTLAEKLYGNKQENNNTTNEITTIESGDSLPSESLSEEESISSSVEGEGEDSNLQETSDINDLQEINNIIQNPFPEKPSYTPPALETVKAPSEVGGKTGFTPVQEEKQELKDREIEDLASQSDYGQTGDDYSFDAVFYPHYYMLDDTLKHVYRQIYANALALYPTFQPIEQINISALKSVFEAVYNDHAELFWLKSGYLCKYNKNGICAEITLQFYETADNLAVSQESFQNSANTILSVAENLATEYQKEKYVHDTLLNQIEYNLAANMNQSAYSALVNGQTVCAGYARAFQYLMQQLGIPCYYCTGYSGQNHAWNIIQLEGDYYNVDTTWDDTNPNTYDYFNKTDADFAADHMRQNLSVYLPACNGEKYRDLENPPVQETVPEESLEPVDTRRTLEEAGVTVEDVAEDMENYYKQCYDYLTHGQLGTIQFEIAIPASLWDELVQDYTSKEYETEYEKAMEVLGASQCAFEIQAEELQGDYYLLMHSITLL